MNALANNNFSRKLTALGQNIPRPKSILCVSAHWLTEGTWITGMEKPKTIHDFYGFPQELFDIQYPALGSPEIAKQIQNLILEPRIKIDSESWGLDHGTWSVLMHLFPKADIPVLQLSLDKNKTATFHFELGKKLKLLRELGVLIVGSGNIVHNLKKILWKSDASPYSWAVEFDALVKEKIAQRDFNFFLSEEFEKMQTTLMSVPTPEHWDPLLYILGASDENDSLRFEYEGIENGSISMRSLSFGM